ncbi:PAS domain-containing protein [Cupriavidus basilensis]|uniref:PAS domain-containing protein n=1 Tax=Cupriavidus basilensis TaxID=68895 RepID=UPI00240FDE7D|nr:PAS domain-containing protein [Cupriavidus basilensis]
MVPVTHPLDHTDADGKVEKWCYSDIEDRKQSETALRAPEERLRLIVDGLPTRVLLFSPEGEVIHVNRHTLEYSGATVDELKQWASKDLTHGDDRQATSDRFDAPTRPVSLMTSSPATAAPTAVIDGFACMAFPYAIMRVGSFSGISCKSISMSANEPRCS